MTQSEQQALRKLQQMRLQNKWIEMQLWPPTWSSAIEKQENRLYINEGRDGQFEDISESFYDALVCIYDSREQRERYIEQLPNMPQPISSINLN